MNGENSIIGSKIAKKIKLERTKYGLSQEELAFKANMHKNTIGKIETEQISPTVNTLEKIAAALGIDFITLVDISKVDL